MRPAAHSLRSGKRLRPALTAHRISHRLRRGLAAGERVCPRALGAVVLSHPRASVTRLGPLSAEGLVPRRLPLDALPAVGVGQPLRPKGLRVPNGCSPRLGRCAGHSPDPRARCPLPPPAAGHGPAPGQGIALDPSALRLPGGALRAAQRRHTGVASLRSITSECSSFALAASLAASSSARLRSRYRFCFSAFVGVSSFSVQ